MQTARDRLIVALDFPSQSLALDHVDRLEGCCGWFKVGLELYLAAGPNVVEALTTRGYQVFLDLKLHDIPNTVAGAVRSLAGCGASLLTVHAAGGQAMLQAAAQAAVGGPRLLAVSVLTSMDAGQLAGIGVNATPREQVLRLAELAISSGISGVVCSPEEVSAVRGSLGSAPLLVVPGIRPAGSVADDQRRVGSPAETLAAGASMLVVGRPITQAQNPRAAAMAILEQMA